MVFAPCLVGVTAGAVEAMGAELAFGKTDALDEILDFAELEGGEFELTGYFLDHALILRGAGCGVDVEFGSIVAFKVLDDAAGDEFKVAL